MTNRTDPYDGPDYEPVYDRAFYAKVLEDENAWDPDTALTQANFIWTHAGWPLDSQHNEAAILEASVAYWEVWPVPEAEQGSVFM